MQTSDGKIVYLLPSKSISTQSSNLKLRSVKSAKQLTSKDESSSIVLNARSISEPISATSKEVAVPQIIDEPLMYSSKNLSSTDQKKMKEVEALEAKISSYQHVVEKYEKLAEDATTAAIDERKSQLRILEEQLRKREKSAKNRLANAMNAIEESQTIEDTISAFVTEDLDPQHDTRMDITEMNPHRGMTRICLFKNIFALWHKKSLNQHTPN